jgi:hypothetical protein
MIHSPHIDAIEPRQLPELRAALVAAFSTDFVVKTWRHAASRGVLQAPSGEGAPVEAADDLRRAEETRLQQAALFAVSPDMTDLMTGAAQSLPGYRLHPDDVPVPVGFCLYGRPVGITDGSEPIVGVSWETMPVGVAIAWYSRLRPASMDTLSRHLGLNAESSMPMRVTYEGRTALLPFAEAQQFDVDIVHISGGDRAPDPDDPATEVDVLARQLLTTWLVMGEPYIVEEKLEPDRATRRRLLRQGDVEAAGVRLLMLRRARGAASGMGGDRRYQHRWIVSGHWRRQWYPSRGEHRPRWIAEHLAGPDDAPLLGAERVRVLRR